MAALQGRTLHRRVKNSHERANRKFTAALLRAKRDKALQAPTIVAAVAADDRDRELGRVYRRVVFDGPRWEQHRSIRRYYFHMQGILTSRIFRGLLTPMLYVASICFGVCLYHGLLEFHVLQPLAPDLEWPTLTLNSSGIFGISTFALSLLLVFRTNSSYERWWEARDSWQVVVNECTHLARQSEQWLPGAANEPIRAALLRWLRVFPYSLMEHLRQPDEEHRKVIQQLLKPEETALLLESSNPPLMVLAAIGQLLAVSDMRIESKTHMDESVRQLQDALGSCEKILTTPIPVSYTRHTGRFLVLWLTCLPFVIWQELGWFSVPISMIVSFLLFGIEEIGVQIEEPFGILALERQLLVAVGFNETDMHSILGSLHAVIRQIFCDEVQTGVDQATADADRLRHSIAKIAAEAAAAAAAVAAGGEAARNAGHPSNGAGAAPAAAPVVSVAPAAAAAVSLQNGH